MSSELETRGLGLSVPTVAGHWAFADSYRKMRLGPGKPDRGPLRAFGHQPPSGWGSVSSALRGPGSIHLTARL